MNTPPRPHDPLLQSFADEASDLPLRAAHEARLRTKQRLRQRGLTASAVAILVSGLGVWSLIPMPETRTPPVTLQPPAPHAAPEESAAPVRTPAIAPNAPVAPPPRGFVKAQNQFEVANDPLPDGLDREQQELFKAARGLPLLLARDGSGKVARICLIER